MVSFSSRSDGRVSLREHTIDDLHRMREIWSNPAAMRYTTSAPLDEEEAANKLKHMMEVGDSRRGYSLAIVRDFDDLLVGTVGVDFERFASAYTHSMVTDPTSWGSGIAVDTYRLLLEFLFDSLGKHRIWTACDTRNDRAVRLIERVGFKRIGTIKEYAPRGRGWVDCFYYSYLDREWRNRAMLSSEGIAG
ncbi:GNAT family N-acetyltransferase [Streptomyces sp. NPDC127051]|uniref:GNAT family N-acetyltransferase n=1 Tax=Streptomyces sp. NPDC127051 TaxID=3347119 RepID=UPI003655009E